MSQLIGSDDALQGQIIFEDVSFAYPSDGHSEARFVFEHLNLEIPAGSCTLFCGPSGSGKSTALRMLNALIPQLQPGHMSGRVLMGGMDLEQVDLTQIGKLSATVFQNPRTQFFTGQVLAELAYAGENYGVDRQELWQRCQDAADTCHISEFLDRSLHTLSGGQLQRVAQATAIAAHTPVLLFDEPTANLSPDMIEEFSQMLAKCKAEGKTIVIAEHRLYFLKEFVDQVVYFHPGDIPKVMRGEEFFGLADDQRRNLGLRTLQVPDFKDTFVRSAEGVSSAASTGLTIKDLSFSYGQTSILEIPELRFPSGTINALVGPNGAGKTTLAKLLCGLLKPSQGKILHDGQEVRSSHRIANTAIVMQDVHRQLFSDSVIGEVTLGTDGQVDAQPLLEQLELDDYGQRHPLSLSGGQKQRLVIAAALATRRQILIFDEPTSGVDYQHLRAISSLFKSLASQGHTVVVITHDQELLSSCANRVVELSPLKDSSDQVTIYEKRHV